MKTLVIVTAIFVTSLSALAADKCNSEAISAAKGASFGNAAKVVFSKPIYTKGISGQFGTTSYYLIELTTRENSSANDLLVVPVQFYSGNCHTLLPVFVSESN